MTTDAHVALATGQMLRLEGPGDWEVACDAGLAWLTEEAQPRDVWLTAGTRARVAGRGLALIEAARNTRLRIVRR